MQLPPSWSSVLGAELDKPYFRQMCDFLERERVERSIFPPVEQVFAALELTPYDQVKVLLLGQDPYHDLGQAHGLCFSVKPPTPPPPSLRNMLRELRDDIGCALPEHGDLTSWARQGVLLLNTVLTVAAHEPSSHKGRGWEIFTDEIIRKVNDKRSPVVFCLWGNHARKKAPLIDRARHRVIERAHPSPLSAKRFLGSRPFSAINAALAELGSAPVDWRLSGAEGASFAPRDEEPARRPRSPRRPPGR
jgi:uracil-DNA glycosylase